MINGSPLSHLPHPFNLKNGKKKEKNPPTYKKEKQVGG
jgi:hypothetical protein